jgi:hypothetical protein
MKTLNVFLEEDKSYNIDITDNFNNFNINSIIPEQSKIVVITDNNVDFYYGDLMVNKIKSFGFDVNKYVVKPGEESKSIETLYSLCKYLNEWKITRNDYLIAFKRIDEEKYDELYITSNALRLHLEHEISPILTFLEEFNEKFVFIKDEYLLMNS